MFSVLRKRAKPMRNTTTKFVCFSLNGFVLTTSDFTRQFFVCPMWWPTTSYRSTDHAANCKICSWFSLSGDTSTSAGVNLWWSYIVCMFCLKGHQRALSLCSFELMVMARDEIRRAGLLIVSTPGGLLWGQSINEGSHISIIWNKNGRSLMVILSQDASQQCSMVTKGYYSLITQNRRPHT